MYVSVIITLPLNLPLTGVVSNGHVRCPWHGACFNIRTGDIEDFPGLDSVQKFDVNIVSSIVHENLIKSDKILGIIEVFNKYLSVNVFDIFWPDIW